MKVFDSSILFMKNVFEKLHLTKISKFFEYVHSVNKGFFDLFHIPSDYDDTAANTSLGSWLFK